MHEVYGTEARTHREQMRGHRKSMNRFTSIENKLVNGTETETEICYLF